MNGPLLWMLCIGALAEEPVETSPPVETAESQKLRWSGLVLAYPSGSSIEGPGLGLGGQIFARPPGQEKGYVHSLTASLYANFRLDYTHNFLRYESNGAVSWLATLGYSGWKNLIYAGVGGQDIFLMRPALEGENSAATPFATLSASLPLGEAGFALSAQVSVRTAKASAHADGLLDQDSPLGLGRSSYADLTFGARFESVDQWPLPSKGWHSEASVRGGGTLVGSQILPMASLQAQVIRWTPLWGKHIVLGARLMSEIDFGERPFYETNRAGLRWRDLLGEDQLLLGYGKGRSRGDSMVAGLIELRVHYAHHHGKSVDLEGFLSVFAEEALLWDGTDPGPHLPTVGVAPGLLFKHAIILRPFFAWGWRSESVDDPRRPVAQFGLSLIDPL